MVSTPRRMTALNLPATPRDPADRTGRQVVLARVARRCTIAAVVVAAVLCAWILGLTLYAAAHANTMYEGVNIAGVAVGGMTREEAASAIEAGYSSYRATPLDVLADEAVFTLTPADIGVSLDASTTVDAAFAYGRTGSYWERSTDWGQALLHGASLLPRVTLDPQALDYQIGRVSAAVDRSPENAVVDMRSDGSPTLVPDQSGLTLVVDRSRAALLAHVLHMETTPIELPTTVVGANIVASSLQGGLPAAQRAVSAPLVLSSAERFWTVEPGTLASIVAVGSAGGLTVDREAVEGIVAGAAAEVDRPPVDTSIVIGEDGSLTIVPGNFSVIVDQVETVDRAVAALMAGEHAIRLAVVRDAPSITNDEASAAVAAAESLIGGGIALNWKDGEARLERADLVRALALEPHPNSDEAFSVFLNPELLAEVLFPVTTEVDVPVRDASFRLVGGSVTLVQKEKRGRATDVSASVESILAALDRGDKSTDLTVVTIDPDVRASALDSISVPDVLADSFTYYGNSSEPRRQNVERAVDLETGWLVPPGGIFSYVEHIGDVDKASGFATGYGIVADGDTGNVTTAPVVGGGICQVSTTIFQAAFWAGMEVVERWSHPYWLTSYGQPPRGMKGLDAMVNIEEDWSLDMKFRNTSNEWIAVVIMYDTQNVTAQILGTYQGWEISVAEPVISNVVPKDEKMYYTESPELATGQEMVVESAAEGFDTSITRTVTKDGEVIDQYTMTSTFAPSRNTTLRGTGQG